MLSLARSRMPAKTRTSCWLFVNGLVLAMTGIASGTQYAWWQRHLMPEKDFQQTMAHLQAVEPHYDSHGNEYDPAERDAENSPMSYRGPGFDRMSP